VTFEIGLNFKIHAWESADYIYGHPSIGELLKEAHGTYPDFDGDGLDSATGHVVQRLEALHLDQFPAEEWPAIRGELSRIIRKSLLVDRELA